MACFNGLSDEQQEFLVTQGYLEIFYRPLGTCERPAQISVETMYDLYPGPRFYCMECAVLYLQGLIDTKDPDA